MKKVLFALALAIPLAAFSQWKNASLGNATVIQGKELIEAAGLYSFDGHIFKQQLVNVPDRFSGQTGKIVSIPNVEGNMEKFEVWEASNFHPDLQAKFPDIRSYVGIGIDDPYAYLRFSLSPEGIQTMTLRPGKSEFIEPYTEDKSRYIVFDSKKHRAHGAQAWECSTPETSALTTEMSELVNNGQGNTNKSNAGVFKTFRLAMSVTGEYSQYFGGTVAGAMSGVNATMTRANGVFEKDFALTLALVANNEDVIYTNPATDPYTNPGNIEVTQGQLYSTLNSVIGFDNYDIGHIFHRSGGGGSAGCIGCICIANKGKGYTSPGYGPPAGDDFDIDYVAHEIGHQLGANHTFTAAWYEGPAQVEPGSGSTIMGYAGLGYNVQPHSDDYFSFKSVEQVQANLNIRNCSTDTPITGNGAPTADAGANYDIPKGTAFKLTGTATDPDNDPLLYNWEQSNPGNASTTGANSRVSFTKAIGPNFRSLPHKTEPVRYFPALEHYLLYDVTENENFWRQQWEAITTISRVFNFKFTVRDHNPAGPQTAIATTKISVRDVGPFKITSPSVGQSVDLSTGKLLVEWDVAGTDQAPINTTNVRILLSTDNGANFTVIKEDTANDGSELVDIPVGTVAGNNARVIVEAKDNVYYALSKKFSFTGVMGTSDINNLSNAGIFPNPNNGQFTFKADNVKKGNVKTIIYDTAGRSVYTNEVNHWGGNYANTYNVKLPTGVYMIVIETADGVINEKLIIK